MKPKRFLATNSLNSTPKNISRSPILSQANINNGFAKTTLLSFLAAYCIVGLQIRNGFFSLLSSTDSNHLITKITGFPTIDGHLGELLKFFLPTVSAESPSLSLFAFYMVGQVLPMQTLVLVEGLRGGNIGKVISFTTIWGFMYQSTPWGIVMPLYFVLYLWTSPIARVEVFKASRAASQDLSIHPLHLTVLSIALALGFILPAVLAAISPGIITTVAQQQALLVFWQGFPIWMPGLKKLRIVYTFSLSITALVHVTTIIFATAAYLRPAYLVPPSRPEVSLQSVFLPMSLFSNSKVDQFYEGCLILLQYDMYFACFSALFWAKLILHRSHLKSARCVLVSKALFLSALVGSGGAALALIWERDEKVLGIELRSKDEKSL